MSLAHAPAELGGPVMNFRRQELWELTSSAACDSSVVSDGPVEMQKRADSLAASHVKRPPPLSSLLLNITRPHTIPHTYYCSNLLLLPSFRCQIRIAIFYYCYLLLPFLRVSATSILAVSYPSYHHHILTPGAFSDRSKPWHPLHPALFLWASASRSLH